MSDFKNVLKAGFLVTTSLLATGCSDDNKSDTDSTPIKTPLGDGSSSGKPEYLTQAPDIANVLTVLTNPATGGLIKQELLKTSGFGAVDVFATVANAGAPSSLALSSGAAAPKSKVDAKSLVNLTRLKMVDGDKLTLDTSKFSAAADQHIGALLLEGTIEGTTRSSATAGLKGTLKTPALVVRNGVINGDGAGKIDAVYAFVGVDAALGYDSPRADKTGKAVVMPAEVNAQQKEALALSAGRTKKGTGTASKHTHVTGVSGSHAAKHSAVKGAASTKAKQSHVAHATNKLTLSSGKITAELEKNLDAAGLHVYGSHGAFDISGRVHTMDTTNTVVTSGNAIPIEYGTPEAVDKAATTAGIDHKTATPKRTTKKKASLALAAAKSKSKATTTKKASKGHQPSTKASHHQTLVKKSSGEHHFLFEITDGYYAEVDTWNVGTGSEFNVVPNQHLIVHNLNLTDNLGVRVYADGEAFDRLDTGTNWADFIVSDVAEDKITNGQKMMDILHAHEHGVEFSDVVEESNETVKEYAHYSSHTSFPLYVVGKVTNTAKKSLQLVGIDLGQVKPGITEAGIYVMPLAKDFTMSLPNSSGATSVTLANHDGNASTSLKVREWKIISNGYNDYVVAVEVVAAGSSLGLGSGAVERALMGSAAQGGHSALTTTLNGVVERLNPTHLIAKSFENSATARINQAAQFASLARGVNVVAAETLGAVEQYAVSFNHNGTQVGFTYNLDGGNGLSGKGASSFGMNVASKVLGLTAIVSADASVDAAKNAYASASHTSYNSGLTLAKSYSVAGVSVVPMAGFGVASNAMNGYSAVVPMAAGTLGLHLNDVAFSAATYHAGVNIALDDFVAETTGLNASVAFGVAGYLASTGVATLSTSEGKSADVQFGGNAVTPYAQFNLGFATGEKLNAIITSGAAAVNFGIER
ncbi:MAG: hypothetical protein H6492_01610 [Candidatus Paracaedibacteraceae bacterium]|nr:hypothetical protein [Candidatus Paracaedibacteraceae bacterium]